MGNGDLIYLWGRKKKNVPETSSIDKLWGENVPRDSSTRCGPTDTAHRLCRSAWENKQWWSFHWLCKPRDTLSGKKYCSHPRGARWGARGRGGPVWCEKGLFAGGIPGCLSRARSAGRCSWMPLPELTGVLRAGSPLEKLAFFSSLSTRHTETFLLSR